MRAPAFWWRPPGLASGLLAPAAALYGAVAGHRMTTSGADAGVPVVCVGNLTVGGSGKTPTALAVAALLRAAGRNPAFLTRGYGGSLSGPVTVDPGAHTSREVGDEPLLLARAAPTVVSRDRPAGAALARQLGADVIVMDDGLQNPSLRKTLALAVFDGGAGIGNGCVLPAGPLRAPLASQWPLIDAAVVVGPGEPGNAMVAEASARGRPPLRADLTPDPDAADRLAGRPLLAFAGIGRPGKFFATLRALDLDPRETRAFPDHHPYDLATVSRLLDDAEGRGLVPVTTEKDAVRLMPLRDAEPRLALVQTVPVRLRFADRAAVDALLARLA